MTITTAELARIRAAAIGDMLGDSKALDKLGPAATVFRLCRELELGELRRKDKPLKVPGWYWYRHKPSRTIAMINVDVEPIEYESLPGQWAGHIHEPREPK
jgi:hypothetical protein